MLTRPTQPPMSPIPIIMSEKLGYQVLSLSKPLIMGTLVFIDTLHYLQKTKFSDLLLPH